MDIFVCVCQLFTTKAQSLLLMTSVAMPVFSKKKETVSVFSKRLSQDGASVLINPAACPSSCPMGSCWVWSVLTSRCWR